MRAKIKEGMYLCFLLFFSVLKVAGQGNNSNVYRDYKNISALKVGDTIPDLLWDLTLETVGNITGIKKVQLRSCSDKKLIILDFWATWCGPCIKGLNQLDSIRAALSNESIEFIPVSGETKAKVETKIIDSRWNFYSVYGDSKLSRYFPHQVLPHLVWIRDGKVMAITGHEYYDIFYFKKALNDSISLIEKVAPLMFDSNKSFYQNLTDFSTNNYLQKSILTKYIPGLSDNLVQSTDSSRLYTNMSLATLLVQANQPEIPMSGHLSRILFNCVDSVQYRILMPAKSLNKMERTIWLRENGYCYGIEKRSNTRIESIKRQMIADINQLLMDKWSIKAIVKPVNVPVWMLKKITKVDKLEYVGKAKPKMWDDNTLIYYRNVKIDDLVANLNYINPDLGIPIVNGTQINFPVDIKMTVDRDIATNLKAINVDLAKYGLTLVQSKAILDMLVFETIN